MIADHARRAVFLDRDGTVIKEADYLADPAGVRLVPGAIEALRTLREADLALVLVTNQSGIARGLYSEASYHAVASRLDEILLGGGVTLDRTYYCPHHPDFTGPCECRKPGTGMYRRAVSELGLDPAGSYFVGDKPSDVAPAAVLGGTGVLVRTGHGSTSEQEVTAEVVVLDDLPAAAAWITGRVVGTP